MSLLRRLAFNFRYFGSPPWDTGVSPPELLVFIHSHPAGRALELGCGTGTNVITLARHGWSVVGVDFAIPAIRIARRKVIQAGIPAVLYIGDVTRLEHITGTFDLILDIGCFHGLSLAGRQTYLNNVERWLSPQGVFIVYAFLKPDPSSEGIGLTSNDLEEINRRFTLVERVLGTDHNQRPSAWLTIQKKQNPIQG